MFARSGNTQSPNQQYYWVGVLLTDTGERAAVVPVVPARTSERAECWQPSLRIYRSKTLFD